MKCAAARPPSLPRLTCRARDRFQAWLDRISFREFKLDVQQNIVGRFAPEGRDVYSRAVLSLLRSSVGAQPLLPALAIVPLLVSLLTERDLWAWARSYKHLAPLERKTNSTVALVS